MAISSTVRKAGPFIGNGIAATFPFTFKVFAASDLIVVQTDAVGTATTLALNTDYTVSLNADQDATPGGDITLVAGALIVTDTLVITSDIPATQGTSIANLGGFYPKVVEDALDKLTILFQQMTVDLERSAQFPITDGAITTEFPPAAARAGNLLGFSDDGSFALFPISSFPGTYAYGEIPAGTMDGVNATFTLTNVPPAAGLILFWNSAKLAVNVGFSLAGNVITMQPGYIPQFGDALEAYYPLPSVPTLSFGQVQEHRDIQHSGNETFANFAAKTMNGEQYADQFAGADAIAKMQAAHDALPATGGIINACGFAGTQAISTVALNITKPGVKLVLSSATFTLPAGFQLTISGADCEMYGAGSKTVFDASTGTSVVAPIYVTSASHRTRLHDFKVLGNSVGNGVANIQIGDTFAVLDSVTVERVESTNASANGMIAFKTTNFHAYNNRVITPKVGGIMVDVSSNHTRIVGNYVKDPNPGATTSSGIGSVLQGTLAHQDLLVDSNTVEFTGVGNRAGMELDSVAGLKLTKNRVVGAHAAGECIAFTASPALIQGNEVSDGSNGGILFFATALAHSDVIFANNICHSNGSYGIEIGWGADSLTILDVTVTGNRAYGQNVGLQTSPGGHSGAILDNYRFANNDFNGNSSGPYGFDPSITMNNPGAGFAEVTGLLATSNGAQWIQGSISEEITLSTSGTTTDSVANLLPGNAVLQGIVARVTTTITTATDWKLGDATQSARFCGAFATLVSGTQLLAMDHLQPTVASTNLGPVQAAAAKLRITTTGTPGAGKIRVTVFYSQFLPATS